MHYKLSYDDRLHYLTMMSISNDQLCRDCIVTEEEKENGNEHMHKMNFNKYMSGYCRVFLSHSIIISLLSVALGELLDKHNSYFIIKHH